MKAKELLERIESETASFEARKATSGIMAAIASRKDHACEWATIHGVGVPSVEMLREHADKDLAEVAQMLPVVTR